jgi:hypothetical protein
MGIPGTHYLFFIEGKAIVLGGKSSRIYFP